MSDWLASLQENLSREKLFATATIISGNGSVGAKMLILADGGREGGLNSPELEACVVADAQSLMQAEYSATLTYGDTQVFVQVFSPPPRLIIIGGVHTAIPLAQFAKILGFRVIVIDGRGRFASRERFPDADEIMVEWPDEALRKLDINSSTYVVILTHDPKFDLPALKTLAASNARYVGAMGSRETRRQHLEQLRGQGVSEEFLQSVYGPVGLDLGARTPEELALSIMAEIIAVRYGRSGGHLKDAAS